MKKLNLNMILNLKSSKNPCLHKTSVVNKENNQIKYKKKLLSSLKNLPSWSSSRTSYLKPRLSKRFLILVQKGQVVLEKTITLLSLILCSTTSMGEPDTGAILETWPQPMLVWRERCVMSSEGENEVHLWAWVASLSVTTITFHN